MAALNPDRPLDFCSANDQSNVEIRFVDEDDFPLINIMEHRASEEEFYSDESQSSEQDSSEDSADESTQEAMDVVEREWSREIKWRRDIDFNENPGINVNTRDLKSCLDFFSLFFTPEVWQLLVSQTNLHAEQKRGLRESSVWYPVTVDEMKAWLSLYLDMGLVTKPSISSYWSTEVVLSSPFFPSVMSRTRFLQILRYLHFADNTLTPAPDSEGYNKLYKIQSFLDAVVARFQEVYKPERQLAMDDIDKV